MPMIPKHPLSLLKPGTYDLDYRKLKNITWEYVYLNVEFLHLFYKIELNTHNMAEKS